MLRADDFAIRHIGSDAKQVAEILDILGLDSLDQLIEKTVPSNILSDHGFNFPDPLDENRLNKLSRTIAAQNATKISMIGMGYYGTVTPPVIRRNVMENPDWYTAYTPYQPEISQARLEVLLSFQQMIIDLTGLEIANASMLDEATAAAEAMMMARRVSRHKSNTIFVAEDCFPQTIAVVQTRAEPLGIEVVTGPAADAANGDYFAVLFQYPSLSGEIGDHRDTIASCKEKGSLIIMACDLLALTLLTPPGEMGADIAVGSSQRFGVPMGFGGPHAAFFATLDRHKRAMPGRLIGVSVDSNGDRAYRMALQTREQHIRRDKATSNICTAQVLLAIMATLYAMYHGPEGLLRIAKRINRYTRAAAKELQSLGFETMHEHFFDTIVVKAPGRARNILSKAESRRYNLRLVDDDHIGISIDETINHDKVMGLLEIFADMTAQSMQGQLVNVDLESSIPSELNRSSDFLTHDIFSRYRSETEFMRYLRRTGGKDITLTRSMIPLGSCTMKLNAASEMEALSNPNFAHLHPFAPSHQSKGYSRIIKELEEMLCEITGYAGFSFQPNAGSQGEYAGLLAIRAWHRSRGDEQRNICLIPSSAHGTNPASAIMAGMKVVVVKCDDAGNIDYDDLSEKATTHSDNLAAIMVTYPSTHGVFETKITEICDLVHQHGGQVYLDGANLNAMVCISRLAEIGADVSHLNLHKTFAIPHGGGGPGMGPIGVGEHLLPFLPSHPIVACTPHPETALGTVSAAPWGSPSILTISWAYLRLLGLHGLKRSTQVAILNANYIAKRLDGAFPVVYKGDNDMVAHECILDCSGFKESAGVSVEDIAKRLIDYGFHAPTMSWPVTESLMIEPTESESKRELDRFCDAMISIRKEIDDVAAGDMEKGNNVLSNAPHSMKLLVEEWDRNYSRRRAFFPNADTQENKYWPPVGRVDNVYGDKNLICTCPPLEAYMES